MHIGGLTSREHYMMQKAEQQEELNRAEQRKAKIEFFPEPRTDHVCGMLYRVNFGHNDKRQSDNKPQSTSPPYYHISDPSLFKEGGPFYYPGYEIEPHDFYVIGEKDQYKYYPEIPIYCMSLPTAFDHMEETLSKNGVLFIKYDAAKYAEESYFKRRKMDTDPPSDAVAIILFYFDGSLRGTFLRQSHLDTYNQYAMNAVHQGRVSNVDLANIIVASYNKVPPGSNDFKFGIDAVLVQMTIYKEKKGIVGVTPLPGFPSSVSNQQGGSRSRSRSRSRRHHKKKTLKKKKSRSTRRRG